VATRLGRRSSTPTEEGKRTALTAAAQRIDLTRIPKGFGRKRTASAQSWQADAWDYYDAVPEVQFAVGYVGNTMSKLRLYAACYPPDSEADADPISVTDPASGIPTEIATAAQASLAAVKSLSGGQAEIIQKFFENTEVVGECYLVYWAERPLPGDDRTKVSATPAQWEVHSADELMSFPDASAPVNPETGEAVSLYVRSDPSQTKQEQMRKLIAGSDVAMRLWVKHPRWSGWATSSMKSCLGELALLQVLSGQVMAEAMSRHNAGILAVPTEADMEAPVSPPGEPDNPEAPPLTLGMKLGVALLEPITDPSSPAAVVPTIVKADKESLGGIKWIDLSRTSDAEAKITARLTRFAHGVNLPPEVIEGHMQTTFANAGQIDEDTFDDYLDPRARFLAQSWTYSILTPDLLQLFPDQGDVISRIFVWYDASDIIETTDPAAGAFNAWDRGLLSDIATRKHLGYDEGDAPSDLERLTRLAFNGVARPTPEVLDAIYNLVGIHVTPTVPAGNVEVPPPAEDPTAVPDASPPPPAVTAAATAAALAYLQRHPTVLVRLLDAAGARNGAPIEATHRPAAPKTLAAGRKAARPLGQRLLAIDQNLRTRLLTASTAAMDRAIERATNKSRGAAARRKAVAADALPPEELLDGAWDKLHDQFMSWGAGAQADALDLASRAVSGLSTAQRDLYQVRQAGSLEEAWAWLERTLTNLATATLLDPAAIIEPAQGELDLGLRVAPGIVRTAMAYAGGATGLQVDDSGGVFLALSQAGTRPPGGIGTGEDITGILSEGGAGVEGYAWVYGPGRRKTFEPHLELDGVEFVNFDDDVLANSDSFPSGNYYMPGDHDGCLCDFEPIILSS
jgi:hypothetical protein